MAHAQTSETTLLLRAWAEGDRAALEQLTPRVYAELRRIAGHCMQNERPGRTLQTTALVHEAYLRLIDVNNVNWEHRAHFFAVSAQIMRRILVDRARGRATAKRAADWRASIWTKSRWTKSRMSPPDTKTNSSRSTRRSRAWPN